MIPMKSSRPGVCSFAHEGTQYPVVDGVIMVPPNAVKHALKHGFLLNTSRNSAEQTSIDLEGAIAKAQAAIPLVLMSAPAGVLSAVVDGQQYSVEDGTVAVPANAEPHLKRHGFAKLRDVAPISVEVVKDVAPPDGLDKMPTEEELEAMKVDDLKAFLDKNEIVCVGNKKADYFAAALDFVKSKTEE